MGGEIEFKTYVPGQGDLLPSYTADALDPLGAQEAGLLVDDPCPEDDHRLRVDVGRLSP